MWESGRAATIDKPSDGNQFARQQLAKDFNIAKTCLKAFAGGVLQWGFGPASRSVVENESGSVPDCLMSSMACWGTGGGLTEWAWLERAGSVWTQSTIPWRTMAKTLAVRKVLDFKGACEHYVTPERAAYLKTTHGDDKNFGSESYGVELS